VTGRYLNYVWIWDNDPNHQKVIGKSEWDGITTIGEITGIEQQHRVDIYADGTFKAGIIEDNEWIDLKTVEEIEIYFINNYDKSDYEHFIPIQIPKRTIAISYFDNTSGDKSYDPLIKGMADMLISDLSNIESIKIVEREKLDDLLKEINLGESKFIDNETAQKMGKGLGAQYILTGSFIVMGDAFRIDARLINVESGEIVFSKAVNGNKDTFFDIEKELAKEIISNLELSVSNKTLSAMEESGTRSYDAYYYWTLGNGYLQEAQYDSALVYYEKSLSHDPYFIFALESIFLSHHSHIDLLYPEYIKRRFDEDWISKIDDITIFINFYKFLTFKDLSQTRFYDNFSMNSYTSSICFIIGNFYCNTSKYINDRQMCSDDDMENALIWIEKAYNLDPSYAYLFGVYSYHVKKDYHTALDAFDKTLEQGTADEYTLQNISIIMSELGNWEKVIEINKKRLDIDPNNYYPYWNIALGYYNLYDFKNAIIFYNKSKQYLAMEEYPRTDYSIADCYMQLGNFSEAIDFLQNIHSDDNKLMKLVYGHLAIAYARMGGDEKTIEVTQMHMEIEDAPAELSRLYTRVAYSYQALGNFIKAKDNYEKAIEQDPNYWNAHNNYAYFYLDQGDLKTAEDIFKANIQRVPNNPWVYHSMGEFYQRTGEYDKAIDYYDSSIERDSTYAIAYYNLGQIYEEWENDLFFEYYLKAAEFNNNDAQRWVKKNKKLIDEHNNKNNKSPSADYIEELKKLAELRDLEIITNEEFEAKKKELLGL